MGGQTNFQMKFSSPRITQKHPRMIRDCFGPVSTFLTIFQIFDFFTSNMTNLPATAFLIYKFVWAETIQKVSSCSAGELVELGGDASAASLKAITERQQASWPPWRKRFSDDVGVCFLRFLKSLLVYFQNREFSPKLEYIRKFSCEFQFTRTCKSKMELAQSLFCWTSKNRRFWRISKFEEIDLK